MKNEFPIELCTEKDKQIYKFKNVIQHFLISIDDISSLLRVTGNQKLQFEDIL